MITFECSWGFLILTVIALMFVFVFGHSLGQQTREGKGGKRELRNGSSQEIREGKR